eukprot:GILJ01008353.1.p1 GENE.GILJ01008353.1~~GILJ01008353.1.p1  ORF type:complete len:539 (+),score=66.74 GILJ01008353.1:192-1619(+)
MTHNDIVMECPEDGLISYHQYVDALYPDVLISEEPVEETRVAINRERKASKSALTTTFTQRGHPGESLKSYYKKIMSAMEVPKAVHKAIAAYLDKPEGSAVRSSPALSNNGEENSLSTEEEKLAELLKTNRYFIVPSFFQLVTHLTNQKRNFAVLFRTFGTDLDNVTTEFNCFCEGIHPCYNGKNGTRLARFNGVKKSRDLRIHQDAKGVIYRGSTEAGDALLALGASSRVSALEKAEEYYSDEINRGEVSVHRGFSNIHIATEQVLKNHSVLAFSDDYDWWAKNECRADAGKLLLMDAADSNCQHIFFDDNIENDNGSIVDVRDCISAEPLHFGHVKNTYLVKVDSIKAIMDINYFIQSVNECEQRRSEELQAGEQLEEEEWEELPKDLSPNALQPHTLVRNPSPPKVASRQARKSVADAAPILIPTREYLHSTIFPILAPALRVIELERPKDPVSFLAAYLLQHQHDQAQKKY